MSGSPPRRYNKTYERLVLDENDLIGMIAYARYKQSKRAWLLRFEQDEGRPPDPQEVFGSYVRAQGPDELNRLRAHAQGVLALYAETVVESQTPAIEDEALKAAQVQDARALHAEIERNTRWWKAIGAGVAAAFLYSLLLIGAVLVFSWLGVDVLAVFEKARPPTRSG